MTWRIYVLLTHPEVFADCRREVDQVLCGALPSYKHLHNLPLIDAVIHQTDRLYPPAPTVMRECVCEHTIGEEQLRIPVGTGFLFNFYNLHRSEKYWREPLQFDYRRWMRNVNGLKPKLVHPFCYLPFAAGARNRIGQYFVLPEAKIVIATIVQQVDIDIERNQKIVPYLRISMKSKYGLQIKARRRSP